MSFSDVDLSAVRHLVLQTANPDDSQLLSIVKGDPNQLRRLIRRFLPMLLDQSVPIEKMVSLFNSAPPPPPPRPPPPPSFTPLAIRSVQGPPATMALPPKYRGKAIPRVPTPTQTNQVVSIPMLPRYESPTGVSARRDHSDPVIGSLAAIVYPSLGPAHVCRVIGMKMVNNVKYFLVVFFQPGHSPCYVASEYLFQLEKQKGLPLEDDEEFRRQMESQEVSVDWILEKIFSSAQNLVISSSDVLLPTSQLSDAGYRPDSQQIQQIMFQCVSSAALLVLCRVCSEWNISDDKIQRMVTSILKANQPKYVSTQKILDGVEESLLKVLL